MSESRTNVKLPEWMIVLPDITQLNRAAAEEFLRCAEASIHDHGRFTVALSGGNTPRSIYSFLANDYRTSLPWNKVFVFFGDERHVPPDNEDSNYRMANESLLAHVPIPPSNVYRIHAGLPAATAAEKYDECLRAVFKLKQGEWPRFDLILLGMGDDGHTASLFPGTAALNVTDRLVVPNYVEKLKTERITLTLPVLNSAAEVLVIIAGEGKADVLGRISQAPDQISYPIQMVRPQNGRLLWMVEQQSVRPM